MHARAREPVRGPALRARGLRREAARARADRAREPSPATARPVAQARAPGRAARLRGARDRRLRRPPRRPGDDPRRRVARPHAVRAGRERGRLAGRARPASGAAQARPPLRRRRDDPRDQGPRGRRARRRRRPRDRGRRPPGGVGAGGRDGRARRHREPVRRLRSRYDVHAADGADPLRAGDGDGHVPPRAALPRAGARGAGGGRVPVGGALRTGDHARGTAGRARGAVAAEVPSVAVPAGSAP